ncbi:CLAVATA3/ESR (CLE)-related protein 5-like [Tripterygium wilfordii]|uniref:CLAVATA3/ESR (CLE)-related protein 5-like n=1 Tax=Tripterygium wilfordii TaxID=458696 RepID=UPI0018F7E9CC|nr:CLAVATA3/ESR (CLE)-related protein 5-like [Tripterygium wilfordii]
MANKTYNPKSVLVIILVGLIVFSLFLVNSSQARILDQNNHQNKHINILDSHQLLHDLGFDLSKLRNYQRLSQQGVDSDRISPGGPDPHHH